MNSLITRPITCSGWAGGWVGGQASSTSSTRWDKYLILITVVRRGWCEFIDWIQEYYRCSSCQITPEAGRRMHKTLSENHMIEHEHQSEQYDIILMSSYNLQHHTWMCGQMWRIVVWSSAARRDSYKICIRNNRNKNKLWGGCMILEGIGQLFKHSEGMGGFIGINHQTFGPGFQDHLFAALSTWSSESIMSMS